MWFLRLLDCEVLPASGIEFERQFVTMEKFPGCIRLAVRHEGSLQNWQRAKYVIREAGYMKPMDIPRSTTRLPLA